MYRQGNLDAQPKGMEQSISVEEASVAGTPEVLSTRYKSSLWSLSIKHLV